MQTKINKPYPEPRVEGKNEEYAILLLQDYAGMVSEQTAVHLYLYQHILKNQMDPNFAKILLDISIVEMHHFDLLGETITLLGMDPAYATVNSLDHARIPWNASYVNYVKEIKDMLEVDIQSEQTAIENYKIHRIMIQDRYIQELLTRIIEDEELHIQIFEHMLKSLSI